MTNGNHFGYLEPDPGCNLSLDRNTIQEINNDSTDANVFVSNYLYSNVTNVDEIKSTKIGIDERSWTKENDIELYKCYILAKRRRLNVIDGIMKMRKERNPKLTTNLSAKYLDQRRRRIDEKLTQNEINMIIHDLDNEELCSTQNDLWTRNENVELYKCYIIAKKKKLKVVDGTMDIWKRRNPDKNQAQSASNLNRRRWQFEQSLTNVEINEIIHSVEIKKMIKTKYTLFAVQLIERVH